MKRWRNIIKGIAFVAILVVLGFALNQVFLPKSENLRHAETYNDLPRDAFDVLFLGSSSVYFGISPLSIWERSGILSYNLSTLYIAPEMQYLHLLDALKYHEPKVVFLNANVPTSGYDYEKGEYYIRYGMDHLRLSVPKLRLAHELATEYYEDSFISYVFPLIRHHSRWEELKEEDFAPVELRTTKGQRIYTNAKTPPTSLLGRTDPNDPSVAYTYNPRSLEYNEKVIETCLEKGIDVVLLTMPRRAWSTANHNALQDLADRYGIDYLDFTTDALLNAVDFNLAEDFYDANHLNIAGSAKISWFLAQYLRQNYALPDRRGDAAVSEEWNEDLRLFKARELELFKPRHVSYVEDGNTVSFTINFALEDVPLQYGWNVLNEENERLVAIGYGDQETLTHTFTEPGKYRVRAFLRAVNDETAKRNQYVADIVVSEDPEAKLTITQ